MAAEAVGVACARPPSEIGAGQVLLCSSGPQALRHTLHKQLLGHEKLLSVVRSHDVQGTVFSDEAA